MNIEDIPSDEIFEMSEFWHRMFNAHGCNPMCYCCNNFIAVGDKFKLGTIEEVTTNPGTVNSFISRRVYDDLAIDVIENGSRYDDEVTKRTHEVMLCSKCTPKDFHEKQLEKYKDGAKRYKQYRENGGGCFRVNGKIII